MIDHEKRKQHYTNDFNFISRTPILENIKWLKSLILSLPFVIEPNLDCSGVSVIAAVFKINSLSTHCECYLDSLENMIMLINR